MTSSILGVGGVKRDICSGDLWLNKTYYLLPRGIKFPETFGTTRVLAWAGRWGVLTGVSSACPSTPKEEIWLKTKVKARVISPVKAVITNKHRGGLGSSPGW